MPSAPEITHQLIMAGARSILDSAPALFQIQNQIEAIEDNIDGSPSIAIDLSRGLVESVCKTICYDLGLSVAKGANAEDLVACLRKHLDLLVDPDSVDAAAKESAKKTISGLNNLMNGLGDYRRLFGTASHGRDGYEGMLHPCHARLVAMLADALVLFLYDMHRRLHGEEDWVRANLGDHPDFDQSLDDEHDPSPIPVFGHPYRPSLILYAVNKTEYVMRLNEYRRHRANALAVEGVLPTDDTSTPIEPLTASDISVTQTGNPSSTEDGGEPT